VVPTRDFGVGTEHELRATAQENKDHHFQSPFFVMCAPRNARASISTLLDAAEE
jgi:hypothetical protein